MINKIMMYLLDHLRRLFSAKRTRRVIVTLFIASLVVLSGPFLTDFVASRFFLGGNYSSAAKVWSIASAVSLQERDMMYANAGNALYRQSKLPEAVSKYDKALHIAPEARICIIKWNMALALVRIGEENEVNNVPEAISAYSRAVFQLSDDRCLNDARYGGQMKDMSSTIKERIKKLHEETKDENKSTYKSDPDFKEKTDEEKRKERQKDIVESKNTQGYSERSSLDEGAKEELYKKTWW